MTEDTKCVEAIIRQIEKQQRKGYVAGVLFDSCLICDSSDNLIQKISVPSTYVRVSGSGVSWKAYGYVGSDIKLRK